MATTTELTEMTGFPGMGNILGATMPLFTIEKTNELPLRFNGELLASVGQDDKPVGKFGRWYELALYKTDSGKYVIEIVFRSNACNSDGSKVEADDHDAIVCPTRDELLRVIQDWDPLEPLVGFPPGISKYKSKQDALEKAVLAGFEVRVGELLNQAAQNDAAFVQQIE